MWHHKELISTNVLIQHRLCSGKRERLTEVNFAQSRNFTVTQDSVCATVKSQEAPHCRCFKLLTFPTTRCQIPSDALLLRRAKHASQICFFLSFLFPNSVCHSVRSPAVGANYKLRDSTGAFKGPSVQTARMCRMPEWRAADRYVRRSRRWLAGSLARSRRC